MEKRNKIKNIIFVTGGMGFIGSNFLNKFVPLEKKTLFVNIDCLTHASCTDNVTVSKYKNYIFEHGNIADYKKIEKIFIKYKPLGIINFAAETHVDKSIKSPKIFLDTNISGTHNLLLLALKFNLKRFHQISTDEVYGALDLHSSSFTEKSLICPNNPYSASKASADLFVRAYNKTFVLNTVITRCSNNYGPNQDNSKLIPNFITRILNNKKLPLYSKGEQIRDWLYVDDHISAIYNVYKNGIPGEVYNIGGKQELSNLEMTKKLLELAGGSEDLIEYVKDRPGHDFRYSIDSTKIQKELNWKPRTSTNDGLKKTFLYYKKLLG